MLVLFFLCDATLMAQTAPPERKVLGKVVISEHDPAVRIELPKTARVLSGRIACGHCLRHLRIVSCTLLSKRMRKRTCSGCIGCSLKAICRAVLICITRTIPPKHTTIGGIDFYVDTWVRTKDATHRIGF